MSFARVEENQSYHAVESVSGRLSAVEILTPPERVHGHYETVALPAHDYVKMSQVRGEKNRVSEELKSSIETTGLLNSIDVACLTHDALVEYIDFVNDVWGSATDISEFEAQQQPDGTYYLVIAGHSRHQAITELEEGGRLPFWPLEAKIHNITTPEEIIQIQLDENIHSQPPRERRAVAIVETFEWGLRQGKWNSQKEFLAIQGDVGKSVLSEALAFSNIPPQVRNFILAGRMSYNAGLELGRAANDLRQHIGFEAGIVSGEETLKQRGLIEERLLRRMIVETNTIINRKLNSTAAEKRIRSWRARMQNDMQVDVEEKKRVEASLLFDLDLKSPDQILQEQIAADKKELEVYVRQYGRTPSTAAAEMIKLNHDFVDPIVYEKIALDFQRSATKAAMLIGTRVMAGSEIITPSDL